MGLSVADAVHPNNNGHLICADLLYKFILSELADTSGPHGLIPSLPQSLLTELYEFAGIHEVGDEILAYSVDHGWQTTTKEFGRLGYVSDSANDSIVFNSSAREVTLGYQYSIDHNTTVKVYLDGNLVGTLNNYFAADWGGGYLNIYTIYTDSIASRHSIKLVNTGNDQFNLEYLLYAK